MVTRMKENGVYEVVEKKIFLMKVIQELLKRKWAFSNMVSMIKFHMMNYISLISFLNDPEKSWIDQNKAIFNSIYFFLHHSFILE